MDKKEKALEILQQLNIYKPYIDGFKEQGHVCLFERFGGYWAYQEPEVQAKIEELEKKYNCLVYAITHEYCEFGECYSFLLVSDYPEEWEYTYQETGNPYKQMSGAANLDLSWFKAVSAASQEFHKNFLEYY